MKIVKLNIFDLGTSSHHGRFVVAERSQEAVECFLCEDRDTSSLNSWELSHHGWHEENHAEAVYKRYIRLYKIKPSRVAFVKDYVLDDPDGYWKDEVLDIYHS